MKKLKEKFGWSVQRPAVLAAVGAVGTLILALVVIFTLFLAGAIAGGLTGGSYLVSSNAAVIGALIALGGVITTQLVNTGLENQRANQQRGLEQQRAQNAAVQEYLTQVGQLLTKEQLRSSRKDSDVRVLARAQTLATLQNLGPDTKRTVLQFLYEAALISKDPEPIVKLAGANVIGANLSWIWLNGANLEGVLLEWADLRNAFLNEADLRGAFLGWADLRGAELRKADMTGAFVSDEQLASSKTLEGATMPDGSLHD